MITLLLAWMEGVYKSEYELLYVGTVIIDLGIVEAIAKLLGACS